VHEIIHGLHTINEFTGVRDGSEQVDGESPRLNGVVTAEECHKERRVAITTFCHLLTPMREQTVMSAASTC